MQQVWSLKRSGREQNSYATTRLFSLLETPHAVTAASGTCPFFNNARSVGGYVLIAAAQTFELGFFFGLRHRDNPTLWKSDYGVD